MESELDSVFLSSRLAAQNRLATLINSKDSKHPPTGFLLDVARFFRNRALQVWGGISTFNGVPLVLRSMNSNEDNPDPDIDLNLSNPGPALITTTNSKNQPAVIDPLSYHVPCPRSSGGIFSSLGRISCFGGSRLFLRSMQISEQSSCTNPPSQSRESSNQETPQHDDLSVPSTPVIPRTTKHGARTQSYLPPNSAPTAQPPQRISPIIYPKTYGDLLVFQRDSKLTNQVKHKLSSTSVDLENESDHHKIQMPIKTTERYYGHFFLLQASKGYLTRNFVDFAELCH